MLYRDVNNANQSFKRIKDKNEPVDFTTVTSELVLMKQLDAVGGFDYLKLITESEAFAILSFNVVRSASNLSAIYTT